MTRFAFALQSIRSTLIGVEFGTTFILATGAAHLVQYRQTVPKLVTRVFCLRAPTQIFQAIVHRVFVRVMARLVTNRSRANKCLQNESMDETTENTTVHVQVHHHVATAVLVALQTTRQPNSPCAAVIAAFALASPDISFCVGEVVSESWYFSEVCGFHALILPIPTEENKRRSPYCLPLNVTSPTLFEDVAT